MKAIENFKIDMIPVWKIIIAITSQPTYEMEGVYIVEDYPDNYEFTVITGGHCSCYDFDQTDWDAVTYTNEEMKSLLEMWLEKGTIEEQLVAKAWFDTKQGW